MSQDKGYGLQISLVQKLAAEFVGTAMLLMVVVGSAIMGTALSGGNAGLELFINAAATGTALSVLILVFGPVSGAHFNPAVSLGFVIHRKLALRQFFAFVMVQLAGAVLGVLMAHFMFEQELFQMADKVRTGPGQWLGEAVATFALLAAIFGLLKHAADAIPYAVGLIITAGYLYTSSTSFANPAVTLARIFTENAPGIHAADATSFIVVQFVMAAVTVLFITWLQRGVDTDG
jgi:glycerol uptake facilitator-like aquaporin